MNRITSLPVAALLAAVTLPADVSAQLVKNTNQSRKFGSVLVGGSGNLIQSNVMAAFIGGGQQNKASGIVASVVGGSLNTASGRSSSVGGGSLNTAANVGATVGGGSINTASGEHATVSGGPDNTANGFKATVAGGETNQATGEYSTVGGGWKNQASGNYATVPGGRAAWATNDDSFVLAASRDVYTFSTNAESFTVRAPGGVRFISTLVNSTEVAAGNYDTEGLTNGVYLAPNSGAWASLSDSNAKTKVAAIKPREILSKVATLPVTEWEYKVDPNRRYIGPTAQDFHTAFGLGSDDKTISTLDSDGVMYAAIQGLVEELKHRDAKIIELEAKSAEVDALKARLQTLEQRLDSLPPSP